MVTFENMTLGQYQALYSIQKTDLDELDKVTESVAILTGKTNREVEDMPVTEVASMTRLLLPSLLNAIKREKERRIREEVCV